MKRDIYQHLIAWKSSDRRKPLILKGARQVGKTYILQAFAAVEYENSVYLDFDEKPQLKGIFEEDLDPERILKELSIYFKQTILPGKTLIIFDEIQECSHALNSLKYFYDKKNEYHVVAAGSLLGVKLSKGFPVGKVNFLRLLPLSFFEFLNATGESELTQLLSDLQIPIKISIPFHERLIKFMKYYFFIGGMPEAVSTYIKDTGNLEAVRDVHREILNSYVLDFSKHAPKSELMRIMAVWNLLPSQLAKENKKFIFSALSKSARAVHYEAAIQWLVDAGLIIKSYNVSTPKLPLEGYASQNIFKVFALDVGLLGAMSDLPPEIVLSGNQLFEEFKGAYTENYVAQALQSRDFSHLYYWTSQGTAEVDFIVSKDQFIFPLEVKAGFSKQKKSLLEYGKRYHNAEHHTTKLSRATLRNFKHDGNIVNYPLYAVSLFPRFS